MHVFRFSTDHFNILTALALTDLTIKVGSSICASNVHVPRGMTLDVYCDPPILGRVINIGMFRVTNLQLCEVEVFSSIVQGMPTVAHGY